MPIYKPYTYLIGWSKLDRWYYGSEYGSITKTANPQNLWTTYFTSSKYVDDFRRLHGEPDFIEIRRTFNNEEETRNWEKKVLRRMRVTRSDRWLNETDNCAIQFTQKVREKMGEWQRGKPKSLKACVNMSKAHKGLKRKPHTEETKTKISKSHIGIAAWNKDKSAKRILCPRCNNLVAYNNAKRWHFENCKPQRRFRGRQFSPR